MILFAGFISLIPAVFIAWLALSKKTSPAVRKVSIIALVCISLTFVTCTILLVFMFDFSAGQNTDAGVLPAIPGTEIKKDISAVLIAAVSVLVILILVLVLAIREQRKK